ncbi:hypothetical protein [Formosa sp. S-31]|uniref:hypothetical protein n=1 Tax=Formosa sp. S-31 TaxID=2790949 RepID=UPI003EB75BE3
MKRVTQHKTVLLIVAVIGIQACSSVPYLKQQGINQNLKTLTETYYQIQSDTDSILLKQVHYTFTKQGRIKTSFTRNKQGDTLIKTEKKLFFDKQSFPNTPNYYCKTRWKTKHRERISCYTQKRYKQNEKINWYAPNGRILKSVDNFTSYYTTQYQYTTDTLKQITIKDTLNTLIDFISINYDNQDSFNFPQLITRRHHVTDSLIKVYRYPEYY